MQDITEVSGPAIICHVCNCKGAFDKGVAGAIKKAFPRAAIWYEWHRKDLRLGTIMPVYIPDELWVINMMAQYNYGNALKTKKRYLDYNALRQCLEQVKVWNESPNTVQSLYKVMETQTNVEGLKRKKDTYPIYIPYYMGCGLAGGDWDTVTGIVLETIDDAIACKNW